MEKTRTRPVLLLHRDPPIRWADLVKSLSEGGFSLRDISRAIAVPHTTVQRWGEGSCPNYEDGRALLKFFDGVRTCVPPTRIA